MFSKKFDYLNKRLIAQSLKSLEPYLRDVTIELPLFDSKSDEIVEKNAVPAIDAFSYILQQADCNADIALEAGGDNFDRIYMREKFEQMQDNLNGLTIEPASLDTIAEVCEDSEDVSRVLGCFIPRERKILLCDQMLETNAAASLYTLQHELAHAIQPSNITRSSVRESHSAEFRYTLMTLLRCNGTIRPSVMKAVIQDFPKTLKDRNVYAWEAPFDAEFNRMVYYSSSRLNMNTNTKDKGRKNGHSDSLKAISFSGDTNLFNAFRGFSYDQILEEIMFNTQYTLNQNAPRTPFIFFDGRDFIYGDGVHTPELLTFTEAIVLLSF